MIVTMKIQMHKQHRKIALIVAAHFSYFAPLFRQKFTLNEYLFDLFLSINENGW